MSVRETASLFPVEVRTVVDQAGERRGEGAFAAVLVTVFNYADHLVEALESAKGQTHARLELIVVDDASTDASLAVARAWLEANAACFARVRLLQHVENQGLSQARNTGFSAAEAAHVMVLDADNLLYPRCVARLLQAAEDTGAGVVYPQLAYFGDRRALGYADVWRRALFERANYVDAMALVRKEAWAAVGGYGQLDLGWEDYDLWLKFVEAGIEGRFVPEILARYRVHGASMLRADTNLNEARIVERMTVRHPWLKLIADV